jgi:hypothetical protein
MVSISALALAATTAPMTSLAIMAPQQDRLRYFSHYIKMSHEQNRCLVPMSILVHHTAKVSIKMFAYVQGTLCNPGVRLMTPKHEA